MAIQFPANPNPGVDFTASNQLIYEYDGEKWITKGSAIANGSYTYPGGELRTFQDRLEDYVSVKDFGAVGDGVTDDTAAFNAAFKTHVPIFIPPGTYKITDTLTLYHPFDVRGSGMDNTKLLFDLNTNLNGKNGIETECRDPYFRATGYISDMSLITTGNANRAFGTEKSGTANNSALRVDLVYQPRYIVERLQVRGNTPGSIANQFTDCWRVGVDIGCGREPVVRDCYFMGSFDENDVNNTDTSAICQTNAIEIGGAAVGSTTYPPGATVQSAVVSALVDHCFIYYYGNGLFLGQRLSQGVARACHINTCWNGIYAPDIIDNYFTYTEFCITDMQIQAQRYGVKGNSGWINCTNVRSSRSDGADTPGYDWYGFHFEGAGNFVLQGCRSYYNRYTSETKQNYGVYGKDFDYMKISDHTFLGGGEKMNTCLYLDNVARTTCTNSSMTNASVGFYLINQSSIIADNTIITNVTDVKSFDDPYGWRGSTFGYLDTGLYSPQVQNTSANINNLSSVQSSMVDCAFKRVGDYVEVTGKFDAAITTTGSYSTLVISLPPELIPENFTNSRTAYGSATSIRPGDTGITGIVESVSGTPYVVIKWLADFTDSTPWSFNFTYKIENT